MTEQTTVEHEIVTTLIKERKRDRRWRNIRFFIWVILIVLVLVSVTNFTSKISSLFSFGKQANTSKPYAALVRLDGIIAPDKDLSANNIIPNLVMAFKDKEAKGVVLSMNCPGGSAVQSFIIHDKIVALKKKYHKKVIVVGEDVLASGGYLVAAAADEIYVNANTATGSIGVIMSGFGFTGAIKKLGITRRVFTAGDHKDRLDSFEPLVKGDVDKINRVLAQAHQNFIADVKQGRGGKLKAPDKMLFSGDFWNGEEATKLGLVDGTDNLWDVLKTRFNVEHYIDYSARPSFVQSILKNVQTALDRHLIPSMQMQANAA